MNIVVRSMVMTVVLVGVAPAQQRAVLEVPNGRATELASPDGRQVLHFLPSSPGLRSSPELWLWDARMGQDQRLIEVGSTARAEWSPDGRHFYIADHAGSDSTLSRVYRADGTAVVDGRAALFAADSELQSYSAGHVYVDADGWIDSDTLRVAYFGHSDSSPVQCFAFTYSVSLRGDVRRLAKQVGPVGEQGCPDRAVPAVR